MTYITQEINDLKNYLKDNNITGISLDIDNTLSSTNEFWFNEFTKKFGNPENLDFKSFTKKYEYIEKAPYYQTEEAMNYIYEMTNSHSAYSELTILDNSSHYVEKLNKIVPIVAYITMRPQVVNKTTQEWLDKHNFPKATLISRPDHFTYHDAIAWKQEVIEELFPNVLGIVDDSQSVATKMSSSYKGKIYLYNCDKKDFRTDIKVFSCLDWQCVINQIENELSSN